MDEGVRLNTVAANGIDIHYAEIGEGPAVLLCHGFPESWYSWRHQMVALANAGYRAIAPDMRGYGGTDAPAAIDAYSMMHLVGDQIGLLDALAVETASIVGHDWGAPVAWNAALMRPDRIDAVLGMCVPFVPRGKMSALEGARQRGWHDFYQLYFQEPGRAEADIEVDVEAWMRRSLWTLSGGPEQIWNGSIGRNGALEAMSEPDGQMAWLADGDLAFYVSEFRDRGYRGALNWYRNIDRNWELSAPFQGAVVRQPAAFITGERDPVLPLLRPVVDALGSILPNLESSTIIPGVGHWVQQEAPGEVNRLLLEFLDSSHGRG